jgi:lysozyme family protein
VGVLKGTNMGIAANTYPNLDIKNLTKAEALLLYKARYWDGINGEALPFGVDLATYDYGVNSGPSRGVKALQSAVGASPDGRAGADTITKAAKADVKKTIQSICASRLTFMRSLKTWVAFNRGWSARVANVEARAVAMWLARGGSVGAPEREALLGEADAAGKTADTQSKAGHTTTAGSATAAGSNAAMSGHINWYLVALAVGVVVIVGGYLYARAKHNRERAKAYTAVANEAPAATNG